MYIITSGSKRNSFQMNYTDSTYIFDKKDLYKYYSYLEEYYRKHVKRKKDIKITYDEIIEYIDKESIMGIYLKNSNNGQSFIINITNIKNQDVIDNIPYTKDTDEKLGEIRSQIRNRKIEEIEKLMD